MDLCYLGETATVDNFYLTSLWATLKQNAALSIPLLRCFDLTTSEQLYRKPSTHFSHFFILSEWASDNTTCNAFNSQLVTAFRTLQVDRDSMSRESICFREIKCQAEAAMPYIREALEGAEGIHINYPFLGMENTPYSYTSNIHAHMLKIYLA